jgi:hypothetical protein
MNLRNRRAAKCPGCGGWLYLTEYLEPLPPFKLDAYCNDCIKTMRQMIASDVRKT